MAFILALLGCTPALRRHPLNRCTQEKRKRDEGKQASGKNYVEEEKRLARTYGYGAGFD